MRARALAPILSAIALGGAFAGCWLDRSGLAPEPSAGGNTSTGQPGGAGGSGANPGGFGAGTAGGGGVALCPVASGYQCVPDPAGGAIVGELSGASCPSTWDTVAQLYRDAQPGCTQCTCSTPSGTCLRAAVSRFSDSSCSTLSAGPVESTSGQCVDVSAGSGAPGYQIVYAVADVGACTPSASQPIAVQPREVCRLSPPPMGGCPSGEVCVPAPPAEIGRTCVLLTGHGTCPSGYDVGTQLYGSANEGRTCSCGCGGAQNWSCADYQLELYDDGSCSGTPMVTLDGPQCHNTSLWLIHDSYEVHFGAFVPGDCPVQTNHSGQVDYGDPMTLCCPSR